MLLQNVNSLNKSMKCRNLCSGYKDQEFITYILPTKINFKYNDTNKLKVKDWEKIQYTNRNQNTTKALLISK